MAVIRTAAEHEKFTQDLFAGRVDLTGKLIGTVLPGEADFLTPRDPSPVAGSVLTEAASVVNGPRRADYGTPLENHQRTADLWNAYLRHPSVDEVRLKPITPRDVCMLNILQKISRDRFCPKRDNLVDIAGYAENAHLCEPPAAEPSTDATDPA